MTVLLTGGAGYIGSHTALILLSAGYDVLVLDNLANSSPVALQRVEKLAGRGLTFIEGDIRDSAVLTALFEAHDVSAVIHFAGLKAVGESAERPLAYYENNVGGTVSLCHAMDAAGVKTLVFSSSATVYGEPEKMPLHEGMPAGRPTNPYGRSKLMIERLLQDLHASDPSWSIGLLRYFNPVGAHESGEIGEDPAGEPNNLLPYISQVAVGRLETLSIFGDDYPTPDGTGVRDYIHVMDLAEGHLKAMQALADSPGLGVWNLGTGRGYSVMEMVETFERVTGQPVAYQIVSRRAGDIAQCWAEVTKATRELGWQTRYGLEDIMRDTWRWQRENPHGYPTGSGNL